MNDEQWQAIIHNDSSYDGKFYYGVTTTRIFCRPSCRSRNPNKAHVKIFMRAVQAVSESFRPCKRCKPDGLKLPGEEWVDQISRFIDEHYQESLTLSVLADTLHTSPYHMHRTFKRIQGVTPLEYIQQRRISAAQALLSRTGMPVTEVAMNTGFPNAAHFSTVFQKRTGMSPTAYRQTYSDELNSGNGG